MINTMMWRWRLLIALAAAVLAGCAQGNADFLQAPTDIQPVAPAPSPTGPATQRPGLELPIQESVVPAETSPAPDLSDSLTRKLVILATQDLAKRLGVSEDQIQLISLQAINWPDASLGCPEPDKVYTQGTKPGYRIILRAAGADYNYHTDMKGRIIYCDLSNPFIRQATPWWRVEEEK